MNQSRRDFLKSSLKIAVASLLPSVFINKSLPPVPVEPFPNLMRVERETGSIAEYIKGSVIRFYSGSRPDNPNDANRRRWDVFN
jgi:hypothetical protein